MMSKLLFPGLLAVAMFGSQGVSATSGASGCGCCGTQCHMSGAQSAMPMAGMPMAASSDKAAVAPEDLYGGQKSCPVTGKPLGSMGKPLAVEVNGQTIYVCCQGCVAKVKANPDFYIAKVKKETGK